jgi:hypothetical protein
MMGLQQMTPEEVDSLRKEVQAPVEKALGRAMRFPIAFTIIIADESSATLALGPTTVDQAAILCRTYLDNLKADIIRRN